MSSVRRRGSTSLLGIALALVVGLAFSPTTASANFVDYIDSTGAHVASLTLQDLLAGGQAKILINNGFDTKEFSGFQNFSASETGGASLVDASKVSVKGDSSGGLNPGPGLLFQGNFAAGTNQTQDTRFEYNVTVVQPSSALIHDINMGLGATDVGFSNGLAKIIEEARDSSGQSLTGVRVFEMRTPGHLDSQTFDISFFRAVPFAHIFKDLFLQGGDGVGGSGLTDFTDFSQHVSQTVVPEPSTMAIAGLGALGLIGYGLRRRRGA